MDLLTKAPLLFEPDDLAPCPPCLIMQDTLLPLKPGKSSRIKIKVINTTNHNIILPDRTPHGRLQLVQSVTQVEVKFKKKVESPLSPGSSGFKCHWKRELLACGFFYGYWCRE